MADIPPLPPGATLINDGGIPPLPPGATLIPEEPKRGMNLDLGAEAAANFIPSVVKNVGQTVEGVGNMIAHPIDTAVSLGKLATTIGPGGPLLRAAVQVVSPLLKDDQKKKLAGMLGDLYGPQEALFKDYAEAYGGKDKFLKTIATDPARFLTDLATIATGGEGALARLPGATGRVAAGVARAAQNLDPLTAAGNVVTGAGRRLPGVFDATANVGDGPMQEAVRSGYRGGPAGADFKAALNNGVPVEEVVDLAKSKWQSMKTDMFDEYRREKPHWAANQSNIGFDEINRAERDVSSQIYSNTGSTLRNKVSDADLTKINSLTEIVDHWRRDPTAWTIEGLDDLKQRLRNEIDWKADKPVFQKAAQTLVEGVRKQLMANAPPAYRRAMGAYTEASRELDNIERAFSLGKNASLQTAMTKLQSTMRNNANTQYGLRGQLLDRLDQQGGRELRPILAGQALSSDAPRGIARGAISGSVPAMGSMLFGAGALDPMTMLMGAAGYGLGRVATSPRTMGRLMYGAGATARPFGRAWGALPETARGALSGAVSQPARTGAAAFDRQQEDPYQGWATGGYFGGGR